MLQLPIDPVRIITADRGVIANGAGLPFQRRLDAEVSGPHPVDEFPNPRDDFAADLAPFIV